MEWAMNTQTERGTAVRKTVSLPFLLGALVILFAALSIYFWQQSVLDRQSLEIARKDLAHAAERISSLDKERSVARRALWPQTENEQRIRLLEDEVSKLREFSFDHPGKQRPDILEVYGPDNTGNPDHMRIYCYIAVPDGLPLMQRLRILAERVSELRFKGVPIEVLRVQNLRGKQIAIVNLPEPENAPWDKLQWHGYFQGSSGGGITQNTLVMTFLQRGYPGKWIDGVQFYYNSKPFSGDWDHIDMKDAFYRNDKRIP